MIASEIPFIDIFSAGKNTKVLFFRGSSKSILKTFPSNYLFDSISRDRYFFIVRTHIRFNDPRYSRSERSIYLYGTTKKEHNEIVAYFYNKLKQDAFVDAI